MVTPAVVWPGLDPHAAGLARRVRRRLGHARRSELAATDSLALVCAALGIEPMPPAALARLADGGEPDRRAWFFAAPVTFVADRDRLVVLPLADALAAAESEALVASFREHFDSESAVLERRGGDRWYFHHPAVVEAHTLSPGAAADASADPVAFGGADARALARVLNEVQMLWHAHPVNEARRTSGRTPANGLWAWGGGALADRAGIAVRARLFGGGLEMAGLARRLGLVHAPLAPPDRIEIVEDAVAVVESGEEELGAAWLAALARAGTPFTVLKRNTALAVPARRRGLSIRR